MELLHCIDWELLLISCRGLLVHSVINLFKDIIVYYGIKVDALADEGSPTTCKYGAWLQENLTIILRCDNNLR